MHASRPVTASPWPASARTVAPIAVNTLDSPLRRGERTNTSWLTGLVSPRTSIMPITLPHAGGRAHRSGVRTLDQTQVCDADARRRLQRLMWPNLRSDHFLNGPLELSPQRPAQPLARTMSRRLSLIPSTRL